MTERVFTVVGSTAVAATPVTLADAGLKERTDLQEWVLAHPEILGPDVRVVTFEFDRWQASRGERERDRLDVLGIDSDGRLVLAELKRDRAPDTVEMQAVKYAAMASRFTEEALVEYFARFLSTRSGKVVTEEVAREALIEHAGELDPELLRRPRIVLLAGAFPPVVTASVVWLSEMGLDFTLQRIQAYDVSGGHIVVTISQLFPVPDVEEFTVSPQRAQAQVIEERTRRTRERSTVVRLVASGEVTDGTELRLRPTTEVGADIRDAIDAWVAEDPERGRATWINDQRRPLQWAADGERYRPTEIVRQILADSAGVQRSVRGPSWWVLPDGRDLPTAAGASSGSPFDWAALHDLLGALPRGRWTTYGELAAVVGTAAMPLGGHVTACDTCPNAWRVLGADGRPRPGFRWSDEADHRSQEEALTAEGVAFSDGVADPALRFGVTELEQAIQALPSETPGE